MTAAIIAGNHPMKTIVLSLAAVALVSGFAAGCASKPAPEKPAVIRKG
jgi:hypothetical protein